MALVNEIVSVADFVQSVFPTSKVVKQNVPAKPVADLFVVRLQNDRRSTESLFHTVVERDFQFVYFGSSYQDVLDKMDALSRKVLDNKIVIPINNSLRYIRVEEFSFSQPFETESKLHAIIGVMPTQVREARTQEQFMKIMQVYARTGFEISTWETVEGTVVDFSGLQTLDWETLRSGLYPVGNEITDTVEFEEVMSDEEDGEYTWDEVNRIVFKRGGN